MQEFSIDLHNIVMEIKMIKGNSWPVWELNQLYTVLTIEELEYTKILQISFAITNNVIELKNIGKIGDETVIKDDVIVRTQSLSIEKCWADGILIEIQELCDASDFYPEYNQDNINYAQENSINLLDIVKTLNFHYNGVWRFSFERPFFKWYNYRLMQRLNVFNHWVQQSHLGLSDKSHSRKLESILNKLSKP